MTLQGLEVKHPNVVGSVYQTPGVKAPQYSASVRVHNVTTGFVVGEEWVDANGQFRMYLTDGTYTAVADVSDDVADYTSSGEVKITVQNGVVTSPTPPDMHLTPANQQETIVMQPATGTPVTP